MRHLTSLVLISSALAAVGIPAMALAAPAEVAIRPQTTSTPVVQSSSSPSDNLTNSTILNLAVTAANNKNFKNCGKGNNDNTGNGTNNGNCRASP